MEKLHGFKNFKFRKIFSQANTVLTLILVTAKQLTFKTAVLVKKFGSVLVWTFSNSNLRKVDVVTRFIRNWITDISTDETKVRDLGCRSWSTKGIDKSTKTKCKKLNIQILSIYNSWRQHLNYCSNGSAGRSEILIQPPSCKNT